MKLTEQQINNISKLPLETQLEIMNICSDNLGMVDQQQFRELIGIPKTTLHNKLLSGEIKSLPIGKYKFPSINIFLDNQ